MKTIKFTKKEIEYLRYIVRGGFVIDDNLTDKEYEAELETLEGIINKI